MLLAVGLSTLFAQTVDTTLAHQSAAPKDTVVKAIGKPIIIKETDTAKIKDPNARRPHNAVIRSAVLPGWGQVYNKRVWKVPIVYAALGGTGWYFVNNLAWYKRTRAAYKVAYNIQTNNDSTGYTGLNAELKRIFFVNTFSPEGLRENRDYYRRYTDYAAVYFIIAWALNVIDATVDAHLSGFDISPDLTFKIQPGYSEMARTNGISFVLQVK